MKLKKITLKNKKYLILSSILAIAITITFQQKSNAVILSDSIVKMNIDNNITYETAIFENEKEKKGLVIEEKVAIDPIYIFSSVNELKYNTKEIEVKLEPKDDSENLEILEKAMELSVIGYNKYGYVKILLQDKEAYIKDKNLTSNKDEIFFDCDYTKYSLNELSVYDSIYMENTLFKINKYEPINIIGENDSSFCIVKYGQTTGYIEKENISDKLPKEVYIEVGNDGVTDYYKNNMYEGVFSEVPDSEKTDENLELLAKIIHCESNGQTEEGKLAVATVVVNRVFDKKLGNTIKSVIERDGQFSPVESGKFYKTSYNSSDYDAAKKVLIDGYRSFPAYVLYFQSNSEGYFKGQSTYSICYNAKKTSPQYFSYKTSDLNKYKN